MIETLARDIHPAEITLPDGRLFRECRVFITTTRLIAYQSNNGLERILDLPLKTPGSVPMARHTLARENVPVELPDGMAYVNRSRGCNCGSSLAALGRPAPWR